MSNIEHFNLRSFDLNLLLTFDALMQERSVTRAAARLKVQQTVALALEQPIRHLLQQAQETIASRFYSGDFAPPSL